MKFDWHSFCKTQGVEFLDRGAKVSRGNINISCPFCDDRGHHLGLSLDISAPSWGCWRCKSAGHSPLRLLCKLLGVTKPRALELIAQYNQPSPDEFESLLDLPQEQGKSYREHRLLLPPGCNPLSPDKASATRFLRYLEVDRGFGGDAVELSARYSLHYALGGEQAWRIVLPVYESGKLVGYTGRSIHKGAELRYKADSVGGTKVHVAYLDALLQDDASECLAIVEGPMDFLKLDFYGGPFGLRSTCTFGTSWREGQLGRLIKLARHFPRTYVIYDRSEYMMGAELVEELSAYSQGKVSSFLLTDYKDPGEMFPEAIRLLAATLRQGVGKEKEVRYV
jgi:hypothetical protein